MKSFRIHGLYLFPSRKNMQMLKRCNHYVQLKYTRVWPISRAYIEIIWAFRFRTERRWNKTISSAGGRNDTNSYFSYILVVRTADSLSPPRGKDKRQKHDTSVLQARNQPKLFWGQHIFEQGGG